MTRTRNARIAGITFLLYIVSGLLRAPDVRAGVLLTLVQNFSALVLAVTLYAITRDVDPDIALFGFACRLVEGVLGAMFIPMRLALEGLDLGSGRGFETLLLGARSWNQILTATFFAVGSTALSWLLLRGRLVPRALAWIGVVASVLLVVGLPLQLAGVLTRPVTQLMWIPMALFEIPLALWLLVRGAAEPAENRRS
ncbi:MAG: DUF4386 domain-containing protein [Myxococcaceae bacterium]